jgi:hypothetical protein
VYLPDDLVRKLDRLAADARTSRNRVIIRACQAFVDRARGAWPEGFFDDDALDPRDLSELREGAKELRRQIAASRRSRNEAPF